MPTPDEPRSVTATGSARPRVARLLVGYGGSDSANAAAAFGLWLAGKVGAETAMVHAGTTPGMAGPPPAPFAEP